MSKVTTPSDSSTPLSERSWPSVETGPPNPESWSVDDVSRFLDTKGFSRYIKLFRDDHSIDGRALLTLTEEDLRNDPLRIPVLGDIKRLAICIKRLQNANLTVIQDLLPLPVHRGHHSNASSGSGISVSGLVSPPTTGLVNPVVPICSGLGCELHCRSSNSLPSSIKRQPLPFPKSLRHTSCKRDHEYEHDTDTDEYSDTSGTDPEEVSKEAGSDRSNKSANGKSTSRNFTTNGKSTSRNFTTNGKSTSGSSRNGRDRGIRQESWKALVAMFYFFCVTWITAFVMVIVHDRVPDMATYPPLPDIFLDNVPLIPWAFQMCELCGLILFIMWCKILVFHKYRYGNYYTFPSIFLRSFNTFP